MLHKLNSVSWLAILITVMIVVMYMIELHVSHLYWGPVSIPSSTIYKLGALETPSYAFLTGGNQWWRYFTTFFLYGNAFQMVNDAFPIFIFGIILEQLLGHLRFCFVAIASGLIVNVILMNSNWANINMGGSVGASGIVFGLLGALIALCVKYLDCPHMPLFLSGLVIAVLYLYFVLFYCNIVHFSALIVGFTLIYLFNVRMKSIYIPDSDAMALLSKAFNRKLILMKKALLVIICVICILTINTYTF